LISNFLVRSNLVAWPLVRTCTSVGN